MKTIEGVPLNSDLGIFLYRAAHNHFPTPTTKQRQDFTSNVAQFQSQKFTRTESINLAFSISRFGEPLRHNCV